MDDKSTITESYIITLDDIDLDLLPIHYEKKKTEDVIPIWSKNNLNARNMNGYYEFEVLAESTETDYEDTDLEDEVLDIVNGHTCHICNIDIPKTCIKEHINSFKHQTCTKIADHALERIKKHMMQEIDITTNIEPSATCYFCEPCAVVVKVKNKARHETSRMHKISVTHDSLLNGLLLTYIDKNKVISEAKIAEIIIKENQETSNVFEKTDEIDTNNVISEANIADIIIKENQETSNVFEKTDDEIDKNNVISEAKIAEIIIKENQETSNVFEKTDDEIENVIVDIESEDEIKNESTVAEKTSLSSYIKMISSLQNTTQIHTLSAINDDYMEIKAINGDRVKVSVNNFHGYYNVRGDVQCRVCRELVGYETEIHKFVGKHMKLVMAPLKDKNCVRKLDEIWNHCILCNEIIENIDAHFICSETHHYRLNEALISTTNQSLSPIDDGNEDNVATDAAIKETSPNYCPVCDIVVKGKLKSHRSNFGHRYKVWLADKDSKIHYHMKRSNVKDELLCRLCYVSISNDAENIDEHINSAEHDSNYQSKLTANHIKNISEYKSFCQLCKTGMLVIDEMHHIDGKKHQNLLKGALSKNIAISANYVPATTDNNMNGINNVAISNKTNIKTTNTLDIHEETSDFIPSLVFERNTNEPVNISVNKRLHDESDVSATNQNHSSSNVQNSGMYFCTLCTVHLIKETVLSHVNKDRHKNNLEIALEKIPALESLAISALNTGLYGIYYFCNICKVKIPNSESCISEHFEGAKHYKKLNAILENEAKLLCDSKIVKNNAFSLQTEELAQETEKQNENTKITNKIDDKLLFTNQLQEFENGMYFCEYCDCFVLEPSIFEHTDGDDHKTNVLSAFCSKTTARHIEVKLDEQVNTPVAYNTQVCDEILTSNRIHLLDNGMYFCELCNAHLKREGVLSHVDTGYHKNNASKFLKLSASLSKGYYFCDICIIKVPKNCSSINDHNMGVMHTRNLKLKQSYVKLQDNSQIETSNVLNANKTKKQNSETLVNPKIKVSHYTSEIVIKNPKHINENKGHLAEQKSKQKFSEEQACNPFVTKTTTAKGMPKLTCKVCEVEVPNGADSISIHCKGSKHNQIYISKLTENKLVKMDNNYFCKYCTVLVAINTEIEHINSDYHITRLRLNKSELNSIESVASTSAVPNLSTINTTSKTEQVENNFDEDPVFHFCEICKERISNHDTNIKEHYEGTKHMSNLNSTFAQSLNYTRQKPQQKSNYQMKFTSNPMELKCNSCKIPVVNDSTIVKKHLKSMNHKLKYNTLLENNALIKKNNMFFCECCDILLSVDNYFDHIDSLNHEFKLSQLNISKDIVKTKDDGRNSVNQLEATNLDDTSKGKNVAVQKCNITEKEVVRDENKVNNEHKTEGIPKLKNNQNTAKFEYDISQQPTQTSITQHEQPQIIKLHFHMKTTDNPNIVTCRVCAVTVPNCISNIEEHVKGSRHNSNYVSVLDTNNIKKVDNKFYNCERCGIFLVETDILNHSDGKKHKSKIEQTPASCVDANDINEHKTSAQNAPTNTNEESKEIQKTAPKNLEKNVTKSNIHNFFARTDNPKELTCKLCNVKVPNTNILEHIKGSKHNSCYLDFKKLDKFYCNICKSSTDTNELDHICSFNNILLANKIEIINGTCYCNACNLVLVEDTIYEHVTGVSHKTYLSNTQPTASHALETNSAVTDDGSYYCDICKVTMQCCDAQKIKNHELGQLHTISLELILDKNRILIRDDRVCFCVVCNVYFTKLFVWQHIESTVHKMNITK